MSHDEVQTALRLLSQVTALLGASAIHVQLHDVSDDVLASLLVAGGSIDQLGDGTHVATHIDGRLQVAAFGKRRRSRTTTAPQAEEMTHE